MSLGMAMNLGKCVPLGTGQDQPTKEMVWSQLALVIEHPSLRTSKRAVSFLEYVVSKTLNGEADQLKERIIGVDVFNRDPDYDTNTDHIVRTAATELRKRLALYYANDGHRTQLRIDIPPGSYIPQFTIQKPPIVPENPFVPVGGFTEDISLVSHAPEYESKEIKKYKWWLIATISCVLVAAVAVLLPRNPESPQMLSWDPVIHESGPTSFVIASGAPTDPGFGRSEVSPAFAQQPVPRYPRMAVGDSVAMVHIASFLAKAGKPFLIRQQRSTSFSDLQNGPNVLIGLFSNEWSLRLTRDLRFSLARDEDRHLLYIQDHQNPGSRAWAVPALDPDVSQATRATGKSTPDYALISRIVNSDTGKVVVIVGGLYVYGTEAAGKLLADSQLNDLARQIPIGDTRRNLQIVLETNVTEGVAGPLRIVAYSQQ